ncbi:MAG TPA: hypothetical protein VFK84_06875 [Burkholderiales bacterium]|nr:hypothetical protein [Burkholderiales bacterium]
MESQGDFEAGQIAMVPQAPGAYRLWARGRVLFVGVACGARSLRTELNRHWRGDFGPSTQAASHFDWVVAQTAAHAHELYRSLYASSGLR